MVRVKERYFHIITINLVFTNIIIVQMCLYHNDPPEVWILELKSHLRRGGPVEGDLYGE